MQASRPGKHQLTLGSDWPVGPLIQVDARHLVVLWVWARALKPSSSAMGAKVSYFLRRSVGVQVFLLMLLGKVISKCNAFNICLQI